jgi:hypothetical protein
VATGFSPAIFELAKGQTYTLQVDDFGSCHFKNWELGGSNPIAVTSSDGPILEAVYNCGTSTVNISTTDSGGSPITGYHAAVSFSGVQIGSCFSPCSFTVVNDQYYDVTVANYGGESFNHWSDFGGTAYSWGGSHTVAIPSGGPAITLTAEYSP